MTGLEIDTFFKGLVAAGVAVAVAAFGFSSNVGVLIGVGLILVGAGEWINRPVRTEFIQPGMGIPAGIATGPVWKPCLLGVLFELLGAVAFGVGFVVLVLRVLQE